MMMCVMMVICVCVCEGVCVSSDTAFNDSSFCGIRVWMRLCVCIFPFVILCVDDVCGFVVAEWGIG